MRHASTMKLIPLILITSACSAQLTTSTATPRPTNSPHRSSPPPGESWQQALERKGAATKAKSEAERRQFDAERRAAANLERARRSAELAADCETTRPARVSESKAAARDELEYLKRLAPRVPDVTKRCSIPEKKYLANGSRGLEVRSEDQWAVCRGGRPSGLTREELQYILERERGGSLSGLTIDIATLSIENTKCIEADKDVGLDTQKHYGDKAGLESLLRWEADSDDP